MADTVRHITPHSKSKCTVCQSDRFRTITTSIPHFLRHTGPYLTNFESIQADLSERKPRKSVAFSEGATIVDSNGEVTESNDVNGSKSTAESHASGEVAHLLWVRHGLTGGGNRRR